MVGLETTERKKVKDFFKKEEKYPYPSRFGSHKLMVVNESGDKVICKDEFGEYETEKWRLDNGLADPNRQRER